MRASDRYVLFRNFYTVFRMRFFFLIFIKIDNMDNHIAGYDFVLLNVRPWIVCFYTTLILHEFTLKCHSSVASTMTANDLDVCRSAIDVFLNTILSNALSIGLAGSSTGRHPTKFFCICITFILTYIDAALSRSLISQLFFYKLELLVMVHHVAIHTVHYFGICYMWSHLLITA